MASAAIEVSDLHKAYGPVEAVRGLSFEVERGEVFGLLGPNGAGKTTTVEILEGYRRRSGGEVRVLGHDPATRDRDLQQRVGIVLQSCGFYPRVTVREAVQHFSKSYDHPRDADETIELVGLGEKADARTNELSGGQRRRLDLALGLVGDPELVFLDEPTTGFDPAARRTAWGVVRTLKELGKTVLLTTHYLDEAQELADRVAIVKEGRIVAEGPPDQLGPSSRALSRLVPLRRQAGGAPDRRPHRAAPPPHARRDGGRRAARRPRGHASHARGGLPRADRRGGLRMSSVGLAWEQFRFERKLFWRNPSAAFFNFLLPLLLLVLIATAFASDDTELEVLIPGVAGMGVLATTFTALAYNLTWLRDEGVLKRIRGTPMPAGAYLAGFIGSATLNAILQVTLVVTIGNLLYGVDWPQDWLLLVAFTVLGVICFAGLGVAFSHIIPNEEAAPAYTNAVFLPVIFISGVFYSADDLPEALKVVAEALPLKHLIDGLSAAIVGGGSADVGTAALVVGGVGRRGALPCRAVLPLGVNRV